MRRVSPYVLCGATSVFSLLRMPSHVLCWLCAVCVRFVCTGLAVERAVSIVVPRVVSATRTLDVDVLGRPAGGVTARITHVSDLRAELLSAGDLFCT